MGRAFICAVVICAASAPAPPAAARPGPAPSSGARLQQVKQLYDGLLYEDARAAAEAGLRAGGNSLREMVHLHGLVGLIAAAQNRPAAAVSAFRRALLIDPRAKLAGRQAPRITRAFEQAFAWVKERGPNVLAISAPDSAARGATVSVSATIVSDPLAMGDHTVLHLRAAGASRYLARAAPRTKTPSWTVELRGLEGSAHAAAVDYYVALVDPQGNEVALSASPENPAKLLLLGSGAAVTPPPTPTPTTPTPTSQQLPLYKTWWVWAIVGVVTVSSAAALGAGLSGRPDRINAPITLRVR